MVPLDEEMKGESIKILKALELCSKSRHNGDNRVRQYRKTKRDPRHYSTIFFDNCIMFSDRLKDLKPYKRFCLILLRLILLWFSCT